MGSNGSTGTPKNAGTLDRVIAQLETLNCHDATLVFPGGTRLLSELEKPSHVYVLMSGMGLLVRSPGVSEADVLGICCRGAVLGAISATFFCSEPVQVDCATSCTLLHYTAKRFRHLIEHDHCFARIMNLLLTSQLSTYLARVIQMTTLSASERLLALLRQLAKIHGQKKDNAIHLALPIKLRLLARLVGVTPEHLSRLLSWSETQGLLKRQNGWLILPEADAESWHRRCE